MAASGNNLVDEFEAAFQNCLAPIINQEHFNTGDQEENKTSVEQSIQKFLDVAKQLECFFLQKRMVLSINKPEQIVKEEITDLRSELIRKEALIQKHYEKLQQWQTMLSRAQAGQSGGGQMSAGTASQQPAPHQTQQAGAAAMATQQAASATTPQQGVQTPTTTIPQPAQQGPYPQGPLAFLEQTTSNIGLPERR